MNGLYYFSSKIRFACVMESRGGILYRDSIYLFQASDFEHALRVAMQTAESKNQTYKNDEGVNVKWLAKSIISLDQLGSVLGGIVEVYSEPVALEDGTVITYETRFNLADSLPTQTV